MDYQPHPTTFDPRLLIVRHLLLLNTTTTLAALKRLTIRNLHFTPAELCCFLERYAGSLEEITFDGVQLFETPRQGDDYAVFCIPGLPWVLPPTDPVPEEATNWMCAAQSFRAMPLLRMLMLRDVTEHRGLVKVGEAQLEEMMRVALGGDGVVLEGGVESD